jgi:hypothetical protein
MTCGVCNTENDRLALVCKQCGGYLQTKIENLDLFATSWGIIERPRETLHAIAIARHKNYAIVLSAAAGFALIYFLFWYIKAGEYTDSLLNVIAAGTATGPFVGIAAVLVCSLLVRLWAGLLSSPARFWQIYAITSYALVPVTISAVLFLPIEFMTFGLYLFMKNPSPYVLKPASYVILMGLDGAFALWSAALLVAGWKSLLRTSWISTAFIGAACVGACAAAAYFILGWIVPGA